MQVNSVKDMYSNHLLILVTVEIYLMVINKVIVFGKTFEKESVAL